jgi:hypothetical protein
VWCKTLKKSPRLGKCMYSFTFLKGICLMKEMKVIALGYQFGELLRCSLNNEVPGLFKNMIMVE